MESYLSSIDTYMKQQEEKEEQTKLQTEQQSTSFPLDSQQTNLPDLSSDFTNVWLDNLTTVDSDLLQMPDDLYNNFLSSISPPYPVQTEFVQPTPEQPVRVRKKPGRKPNPASPAIRKAQNRAAQRAFRERKERHLKDLENTIRQLREQRTNTTKELNTIKKQLESYKVENWYLKGVVLTLQFICMHNNVQISTHAPYLSELHLNEMAKTAPHAVEAYINAYKRNNSSLKSSLTPISKKAEPVTKQQEVKHEEEEEEEVEDDVMMECVEDKVEIAQESQPEWLSKIDESDADKIASISPIPRLFDQENPPSTSLDAIHYIRLKLGLKATLANNTSLTDISAARLKPTVLQLAIPHDPRIDLIPTQHMRDRMIIFRDQMDYDRCFTLLVNEAVFHGGDPTMSESWELPPDFFSEFWYLLIDYDVRKTNKWRRMKGLPEVIAGPMECPLQNPHSFIPGVKNSELDFYNEQILDEIVKNMPVLKPLIESSDESSSVYDKVTSPSSTQITSPSYDSILELMKTL